MQYRAGRCNLIVEDSGEIIIPSIALFWRDPPPAQPWLNPNPAISNYVIKRGCLVIKPLAPSEDFKDVECAYYPINMKWMLS